MTPSPLPQAQPPSLGTACTEGHAELPLNRMRNIAGENTHVPHPPSSLRTAARRLPQERIRFSRLASPRMAAHPASCKRRGDDHRTWWSAARVELGVARRRPVQTGPTRRPSARNSGTPARTDAHFKSPEAVQRGRTESADNAQAPPESGPTGSQRACSRPKTQPTYTANCPRNLTRDTTDVTRRLRG